MKNSKKNTSQIVKCFDERKCFAKRFGQCVILTSSYAPGDCPFCKPDGGNIDANFRKYERDCR